MSLSHDIFASIVEWAIVLANGNPSAREAPLNISHTCYPWREFMLSNGRFWARLESEDEKAVVNIRIGLVWLDRSSDALLEFHVKRFSGSGEDVQRFEQLLFEKQSFWRVMEVPLQFHHDDVGSPRQLNNLSNLTSWTINIRGGDEHESSHSGNSTSVMFFAACLRSMVRAPRLVTLHCDVIINGDIDGWHSLLAMIAQCNNLTDLSLALGSDAPMKEHFANDPICTLPQLVTLTIKEVEYRLGPIHRLRAPSLHSLFVEDSWHEAPEPETLEELSMVLSMSYFGQEIKEARICTGPYHPTDDEPTHRRLFRALPNVMDFETYFAPTVLTFNLLSFESGGGCLCPRMQRLTLRNVMCGLESEDDVDSLVRMLSSRFSRSETFIAVLDGMFGEEREALIADEGMARMLKEGRLNLV